MSSVGDVTVLANPAIIRPATIHDVPGAYRVCLQTADCGADATAEFHNIDLLGHLFVGPYIAWASDYALVVTDDQGVAGYSLAVSDTESFEAWAETAWWPTLRAQYPLIPGESADAEFIRRLHTPLRVPRTLRETYPAHLHIDLLPRVRGHGFGRALIARQLARLRGANVRGVHLGVDPKNVNAVEFYRHLGFDSLSQDSDAEMMGLVLS